LYERWRVTTWMRDHASRLCTETGEFESSAAARIAGRVQQPAATRGTSAWREPCGSAADLLDHPAELDRHADLVCGARRNVAAGNHRGLLGLFDLYDRDGRPVPRRA